MFIKNILGEEAHLQNVQNFERERNVNGERTVSFVIFNDSINKHMFHLVENESIITLENAEYVIKQCESRMVGNIQVKSITAIHRFFCDLLDNFVYEKLTGSSVSISYAVTHAVSGTNWTVFLSGMFPESSFENWGNDNSSKLFSDVLNRYQAEFTLNSSTNTVTLRKQIGDVTDKVFRYKANIKTISEHVDTTNLSTYIEAYGKVINKQTGERLRVTYTSPNAAVYGIRHAQTIDDERFTDSASLLEYAKSKVIDVPQFELSIDVTTFGTNDFSLGDTVHVIHEKLGIEATARITKIVDYPYDDMRVPQLTLSNYKRKTFVESVIDSGKEWESIFSENGKIKFDLLESAVKIATEALNNSMTELEYPDSGGIIARSKTNSNHIVRFNSAGVGISVDGGLTYRTAMTAMGLVADVLTAGTINANFVRILGGTTSNQVTIENGKVSVLTPSGRGARLGDGYAWFAHEDGYGLYIDESGISSTRTPDILNSSGYVRTHNDTYNRGEDGLHLGSASHISNLVQNGPVIFTPKKAVNWNSLVIDKYSDTGEPYLAGGTHNNYNMKLVFASNELKVYDKVGGWGNIKAATFTPASSILSKKNIEPYNTNALQEIVDTDIVKYHLKSDLDTEEKRVGVIMQEAPSDIVDIKGDGVDLYAMVSMSWKAIQQLKEENKALKQRIEVLENGSN